jgi:hypothetical protein
MRDAFVLGKVKEKTSLRDHREPREAHKMRRSEEGEKKCGDTRRWGAF